MPKINIAIKKIYFHLKLIYGHAKPFKLVLGYALLLSGLSKFIKIKKKDYQIKFSRNVLALSNFIEHDYRQEDELILKYFLSDDCVYVDIGANIGTLSLALYTSFKNLKVYAFEANPKTYNCLVENFKLNNLKDSVTFQLALGKNEGEVNFADAGTDDQNGVIESTRYSRRFVTVPMKKMDDIFLLPNIDLLKIDVEGYELFVLEGAIDNLKRCKVIAFEYSPINSSRYNYHPSKLIYFLMAMEFTIYVPTVLDSKIKLVAFEEKHKELEMDMIALNNRY